MTWSAYCAGPSAAASDRPDVVVVGLGSPVLSDDAVGLAAARVLAGRLPQGAVAVREAAWGGIRLMELLAGFRRAVIVDAITWRRGPPGTVTELGLDEAIPTVRAAGYHDLSLRDALGFGRTLGIALPEQIVFLAVEAADTTTFGEALTPSVAAALPEIVRRVETILRGWGVAVEQPCTS